MELEVSRQESLTAEQFKDLEDFVAMLLPADGEKKLPSAKEVGAAKHLEATLGFEHIRGIMTCLNEISLETLKASFQELSRSQKLTLFKPLQRKQRRPLDRLTKELLEFYYQDPRVLKSVGIPSPAPFPKGYEIDEGDLLLLEDVYLRGQMYRSDAE